MLNTLFKHNIKIHLILFILLITTSCSTIILNEKYIKYDEEKEFYTYGNSKDPFPLRDSTGKLISKSNFESFYNNLRNEEYKYDLKNSIEQDHKIVRNDHSIAELYIDIQRDIEQNQFNNALKKIDTLKKTYPDIIKFSDCLFLEGYANEKLMNNNTQQVYESFISLSGQKYSARFRGYRDADTNDNMFLLEKRYVQNYLYNPNDITFPFIKTMIDIYPKYYYSSYSPGFTFNNEDFIRKNIGAIMFIIGAGNLEYYYGFQYFSTFNQLFCVNPRVGFTTNLTNISIAFPMQVYKHKTNKYGIKFSPFIDYFKIDSLISDDISYYVNENAVNYGFKISGGYYLMPKVMIGTYYKYNVYNSEYKYRLRNNLLFWFDNTYDISIYYNIVKTLSIKAGINNNIFLTGVTIGGF